MSLKLNQLQLTTTAIEGLLVVQLPLVGDARGWFKEHWQREKMTALGLPDFRPIQQNVSFNSKVGTTRGVHAEPWDKYVSVANGSAFGAWVDLREGPGFGAVFTTVLEPGTAVFVPRGVANAFQTLENNVNYMYLVNDHWSAEAKYAFVNLADPTLGIPWPIPLQESEISEKDLHHPDLSEVVPIKPKKTLVLGANGQLGQALRGILEQENSYFVTRAELDINSASSIASFDWSTVGTVINAAAYTAVDAAETATGRREAWQTNAVAVGSLADVCLAKGIIFVSVSSDYVFDGTHESLDEAHQVAPLNVYGASKAAGEIACARVPQHYLIRTSWVIGEGSNFVRTMEKLARSGVDPKVIDDQTGRLTFADDLAAGIRHLLDSKAPFGTYNLTNSGHPMNWYEIARAVFSILGENPDRVVPTSSDEYAVSSGQPLAKRPTRSIFDLSKIESTGFEMPDALTRLSSYLQR